MAPKIIAAWIGNQMIVMARYQNNCASGVSVSGFSSFGPRIASSKVIRYQA